jgi:hypothetical protein
MSSSWCLKAPNEVTVTDWSKDSCYFL